MSCSDAIIPDHSNTVSGAETEWKGEDPYTKMGYDVPVLLDHVAKNMRVLPRGLSKRRKLVKLFRKPKSKLYWDDFTVRGHRYGGSTQETKAARASKIAGLKLAQAIQYTDELPYTPTSLDEFSQRFFSWLDDAWLENQTKRYYRNGWRLLKSTAVAGFRIDQITNDSAERLGFTASSANANCALRTLRRMLHKAEEWNLISRAPKIKLMKEHGRSLRLDDATERRLLAAATDCNWRKRTRDFFRDIVLLIARHRNEKSARTLPDSHRESRLGEPADIRAGQ